MPGAASASQLIDRDASQLHLLVARNGTALLQYNAHGIKRQVAVWGAINARHPNPNVAQVKFKLDYSGRTWRKAKLKNACRPYDGPELAWFVTGCTASDGSYWAVQSWQRVLPDLGFTPWLTTQTVWELHISHWTGPVAELTLGTDWVYHGRWEELFGQLTYRGVPVHGFKTTSRGVTLDGYGRNLYLDTFDSVYGPGWRRENGFVTHKPNGNFCYGFYPFKTAAYSHPTGSEPTRGPGVGARYRISVIGPGVTPDVSAEIDGLHPFDAKNPDRRRLGGGAGRRPERARVERHALQAHLAAHGIRREGRPERTPRRAPVTSSEPRPAAARTERSQRPSRAVPRHSRIPAAHSREPPQAGCSPAVARRRRPRPRTRAAPRRNRPPAAPPPTMPQARPPPTP